MEKVVRVTLKAPDWFRRDSPPGTIWRLEKTGHVARVVRWKDDSTVWVAMNA